MCFLVAASTAAAVANVTNTSFKSSTVPLQPTVLACDPLERASKETAMVLDSWSRKYGPPCTYVTLAGTFYFYECFMNNCNNVLFECFRFIGYIHFILFSFIIQYNLLQLLDYTLRKVQ